MLQTFLTSSLIGQYKRVDWDSAVSASHTSTTTTTTTTNKKSDNLEQRIVSQTSLHSTPFGIVIITKRYYSLSQGQSVERKIIGNNTSKRGIQRK